MKILMLADGLFPFVVGGMQRHSAYVVKFLLLRGHEVTVGHFVTGSTPIPTRVDVLRELRLDDSYPLENVCVRFPSMGILPGHYLKESFAVSKILFEILSVRLDQIEFIYSKGFLGWYFIDKKKKGMALPPIGVKFHGYEMFQANAGLREWLNKLLLRAPVRWINRNADFVFSYGGKITGIIRELGVSEKKIIEVPSGIEASWCLEKTLPHQGNVRFLFIGRFERRKGVKELNKTIQQLSETKNWSFEFIGPIPQSARILSERITYHGQITDRMEMQARMDRCDVLVVPSFSEGMPNVIMEAMARGLAILATDVGAISEQVSVQNGWLLEHVSMELLVPQMEKIIDLDREEIDQMRRASLQRVRQRFTWESVVQQLESEIAQRRRIIA